MVTIITNSALSTFRQCPRKFYYAYVLKRKTLHDSDALRFGSAMHEELEKLWLDGDAVAPEVLTSESAKINALLQYYSIPEIKDMKVLGVERVFTMGIETPEGKPVPEYVYAGKIDVLLQDNEGLWVLDHKTTGKDITGFGMYWKALQLDSQMSWYCMAVKAIGFIYDVIKNPSIRMSGKDDKVAEEEKITPEKAYHKRICEGIEKDRDAYFQFRRFHKTAQMEKDAMVNLFQQSQALDYAYQNDAFYQNCNSCSGIYGTCAYLGVCTGLASIEDDSFFKTKEFTHEELEL